MAPFFRFKSSLVVSLIAAACACELLAPRVMAVPRWYYNHASKTDFGIPSGEGSISGDILSTYPISTEPSSTMASDAPITAYYYSQPIDHNNPAQGQFQQKFYVNSSFWKPGGPVFLHTSGEEAARTSIVTYSGVSELSASFNALLITIEHRYYGSSFPPISDLSTPNMRYLTVDQVLADFANFIRNPPSSSVKIPQNTKWIFIGGSYAGNLAAWMRLKYSNLVFAAYSSSAPLLAKINFVEYDQMIAQRLPCRDLVGTAVVYVDGILKSGNRQQIDALKKQYTLDALDDDRDFASALNDQLNGLVTYYFPPTSPTQLDTIATFCGAFQTSSDKSPKGLSDTFAYVTRVFNQINGYTTPEKIKQLYATKALTTRKNENDQISWMWQYCNNFGYFQNAPAPPQLRLRSIYMNTSYYESQCQSLWPDIPNKLPNVGAINNEFGGNTIDVSRVVFVTGDSDPWTPLSVSASGKASTNDMPIFSIQGGSHETDLQLPTVADWDSLKAARKGARDALARWLTSD